jgi:hypothetical protein
MLGIKPNGITAIAVKHPVLYSAFTALLVFGIAQINADRGEFVLGSALIGLAVGVLNWILWRPTGPGSRWATGPSSPTPASTEGSSQR